MHVLDMKVLEFKCNIIKDVLEQVSYHNLWRIYLLASELLQGNVNVFDVHPKCM